jgi:LysM repeat protein
MNDSVRVFGCQVKHPFAQHMFDEGVDERTNVRHTDERSFEQEGLVIIMTTTFQVHLPLAGLAGRTHARSMYVRRRVGALTFVVALVVSVGSVAQHGLADRGDDPASVSAIGRSTSYVAQPGDTLWSIAERFYPGADIPLVVDALITLNGGTSLDIGQAVRLP